MGIGSRVVLIEDIDMPLKVYKAGHEFTIYNCTERGFNLVDDDDNKIDETRFIHDKYKLVEQAKIQP